MSEYQAEIDAQRDAATIERRLKDLENIVANWMQNGAEDMFGQSGGQVYGGGIMRLDNNGIQIKTPTGGDLPALFYVDDQFSSSPSDEYPRSQLAGQVSTTTTTIQMGALMEAATQAAWNTNAQDLGSSVYVSRNYPAAGFLALGNSWSLKTVASGVVAIGQIGRSLVQIRPETGTSDTVDEITGPIFTGELLIIRPESTGDVITVAHDVNKIVTSSGSSVVLTGPYQMMGLIRYSFSGPWVELFNNA